VLDVPAPLGIVYPESAEQIAALLKFCNANAINVIPRAGMTATEGGLENWKDTTLVATRSIGQFSTLYGGIEDMVVGLECVFPNGHISRIKNVSRRAGGPDIRHIVIGNEGALCYITEVTVKIFRHYPENNAFFGYLIKDVAGGIEILREVMVNGYRPSVARVYSEEDAAQHFSKFHDGKCVLLFMAEGPKGLVDATGAGIEAAVETFKDHILEPVDPAAIEDWFNHLNWSQAQIDREFDDMRQKGSHDGYTTEVSADWETIPVIYDPEDELLVYHHPIQKIIVEETLKHGGSMCHHHGIGKYRSEWAADEHGSAFYMLEQLKAAFDPNGIMNHGTIYPQRDEINTYIYPKGSDT